MLKVLHFCFRNKVQNIHLKLQMFLTTQDAFTQKVISKNVIVLKQSGVKLFSFTLYYKWQYIQDLVEFQDTLHI